MTDSPAKDTDTAVSAEEAVSRVYELGYHLLSTIPEEEVAEREAALKELVQKHKGEVIASEEPKRVELAYTIKKKVGSKYERHTEGYFGWMKFTMDATGAGALNQELLGADDVLRHIIFKTVREDTRAGIRGAGVQVVPTRSRGKRLVTEDTGGPSSEEDIERTVDALVAETEEGGDDEKKDVQVPPEASSNAEEDKK